MMKTYLSKEALRWIGPGILLLGGGWITFSLIYPKIVSCGPRTEDQVRSMVISNAIVQFNEDYGHLPVAANSGTGVDFRAEDRDMDTSAGSGLVAILLGAESGVAPRQNPKGVNYVEGLGPAKPSPGDRNKLLNGLVYDRARQLFGVVDKWGTPYRVRLDNNSDKELANPISSEVAEGRTRLPKLVIVWSAGEDKNWDTWEDNKKSWD